jgi:tRNA A37 threonylcarbamoyladenosine dehydratase
MSYSRIIWIDLDVNNDENKKYLKKLLSKFKDLILEATDDIDIGIELIKTSVKAMVICSGGVAKAIVPKIQYF